MSERVASVILKPNDRYNLKIIQIYGPTCSHSDEEIESLYEDVQAATDGAKTHFTMIMGDFHAKIGIRVGWKHDTRNERRQTLIKFAETRSLRIMNTVFEKRPRRKWT